MTGRKRGHLVGWVALTSTLAVLIALTVGVVAAQAAESDVPIDDEKLIIDLGGQVYAENCDPCHGNIANTDNYSSEIIFQHGYHQLIACSSCHSRFPHRPEGTERPTMDGCFDCHGLQHGPMGQLATGECEDCHNTPVSKLRPSWHTYDWAEEPHVKPGEKNMQTECMMCHDEAWCVDCHDDEYVVWDPGVPYKYDSGEGCYACHGDENLTKTSEGRPKSYQVVGVEDSAHRDLSCQQCHIDYKYEEGPNPTPIWNVNAGLACQECHDHEEQKAEYLDSIHGMELASGNMESATCASCHGGHYIQRLDTEAARRALHGSAYRICARCHPDQYESYDDYYHGAAYKRGAVDAPACWDCHGAHNVLPTSDPDSLMSDENRADTCGQCHKRSSSEADAFAAVAGDLIHQKSETAEQNWLKQQIEKIRSWFG